MTRRVRRCGDRAFLLDVDDVHGTVRALRALPPVGLVDVVPGAATVLVVHTADADAVSLEHRLNALEPVAADASTTRSRVTIEVVYDGEDLRDVAEATGLAVDEIVARHSGVEYEVAFCGFSPGFGYLRGLDPRLVVPRLDTPRTVVPAGSVAIADTWSAVYPRASPGGWRILGRTSAVLWDLGRPSPALLTAGARVRFAAVAP
jgi:KipI family sensor histidine kinase inhibitor